MNKLIATLVLTLASATALADTLVIQWKSPKGNIYTYYLDKGSARQMNTTVGVLVTAKVEIMDPQGILVAEGNVVASGCELDEPIGQAGLMDDDNALLPDTHLANWSMKEFNDGSQKIAVILAGNTCLAARANNAV
jgi:hypothetical protein